MEKLEPSYIASGNVSGMATSENNQTQSSHMTEVFFTPGYTSRIENMSTQNLVHECS